MIASKCQGGLALNIHIPFRVQDEILLVCLLQTFWEGGLVGLVLYFCILFFSWVYTLDHC